MKTQRTVTLNSQVEKRNILIEKYWNSLEEKPELTFKEFETICKTPFRHARKKLGEDILYDIRFKYLGQFTPSISSLFHMLKLLKKRLENQQITQTTYDRRVKTITDYIRKQPKRFEYLKERLIEWISL